MNTKIAVTSCLLLATTPEMLLGGCVSSHRQAEQQIELVDPDRELAEAKSKLALLRAQHKVGHPALREQLRRVIVLEGLTHVHGPRLPAPPA